MKNTQIHPADEELDPKRLKFGMSPQERKELETKLKKKKRKSSWNIPH